MSRKSLPTTKKLITLVLITASLLSACGSNLWGSYALYQTEAPSATPFVPFFDPSTPTETPPPTATMTETSTPPPTPTNTSAPTDTVTPPGPTATAGQMIVYTSQSWDSLQVVAIHFGVGASEISSAVPLTATGFIDPDTRLIIPNRLSQDTTPTIEIMPDSEVVFSPTATDFDVHAYISKAGGKLSTYKEYLVSSAWTAGADDLERIAYESSTNPRLLLAVLQYFSGWVQGQPNPGVSDIYPMGVVDTTRQGLYQQLHWAISQLSAGYYGWRDGKLTQLTFPDGTTKRIAPNLNAGTVAIQYLFSTRYNYSDWLKIIDPQGPFMHLYDSMFGDPTARAEAVGPLFPPGLNQPQLSLPFEVGRMWSLTGGPHPAWEAESSWAAMDFAPASDQSGCVPSEAWVLASAPGRVVRSALGYVVLDLDGDGYEQTGWDVLYLHIATKDRAPLGVFLIAGDRVGHPSCEGGEATGTHMHFARKYNGEWVAAAGPLPFVLSGWTAHGGAAPYIGSLTKGNQVVTANQNSAQGSAIMREPGE
jgi:LasA protease